MGGNHTFSGHSHDHDHEDEQEVSLQSSIDKSKVYCLNEHLPNAGRSVLKSHADRFSLEPNLQSTREDEDVELLFHIPFSEAVSIRTLSVGGRAKIYLPNGDDLNSATSAPSTVKVFANRNDLDFDTARELTADCLVDLLPPEHAFESEAPGEITGESRMSTLDYPLRPSHKFKYCTSITLFFGDNYAKLIAEANGTDDDVIPTEVTYVGIKGVATSVKRQAVECVYETRGMKKDHKVPGDEYGMKESI
mmetsp:Transcript_3498/g.6475  ORF Transcript_3498/g.6475 Transcript_3498/m.6475 type:complete len:249 (-) Transcript_3498:226-972(-)|eukprot:CAMPEP_0113298578 /NCGR_PEP_ID=MMETSP0010_2-20120614/966_1 /TAXON_ID=216773 ORGANISM="Corethron hystrix, Strain 308" /NCGR_SAMPLE_ID=MMETSP0010_2 /ASSEMBLY_ACC=CAM_ASM_000155 /LENGTH=248 /DNA_ID=CAMNT_0000151659 /DNA_START=122 /DNA_END=868 /DNA_ORIENTATION=- /assembly_acc=CAM_ASM_000155